MNLKIILEKRKKGKRNEKREKMNWKYSLKEKD